MLFQPKILTEEQLAYLDKHFKHTNNSELCRVLGCSKSFLHKIASRRGLKKSRQFIKATNAKTAANLQEWVKIHGPYHKKGVLPECLKNSPSRFTKGQTWEDRFGKAKAGSAKAKMSETRRKIIAEDRARIMFGLPQKTKLRLSSAPRALKSQAYRLRKRGYTIDYATKTAFYDENTNRCFLLEGKKRGEYRAKGRRWGRLFFDFKPAASSQAQRASAL
jgi:hypothetical protein